jgi:serine/threonine protein kinase
MARLQLMSKQTDNQDQTQLQSKLDAIADDFLVRSRRGESPSIADYTSQHPEMSDEIRELLQTIQFVNNVRPESGAGSLSRERDDFKPGTQFGNYLIEKRLGSGGMGVVYEATHLRLKRKVALKVTKAENLSEAEVARFEREMEASGQLNSPNVVASYDAGEIEGIRFLAMELVEGHDLRKVAIANAPMSVGSATELIRQAACGLQQAHEAGLVHRDIKPSNLMLSKNGVVKILDLGLAKIHAATDSHELTHSHQIMGTVDYIASEQCKDSRSADIRSDIYSLGATLCKLLTGEPPYSGPSINSTLEKLTALVTVDPPSIGTRRSELPAELIEAVNRMTRRDPAERFQSPGEVVAAMEPFADATKFPLLLKKSDEVQEVNIEPVGTVEQLQFDRETSRANPAPVVSATPDSTEPSKKTNQIARIGLWLLGAACVAAMVAFAFHKLKIETPNGNIVIRTEGGETEISVLGETAKFVDPADGKEVTVSIDKEAGKLKFDKSGFNSVGESFEVGTADQKVFIAFEPNEAASKAAAETVKAPVVFAVAAFDNRQGYSYVFYNNGRYDKVANLTNKVRHQLDTHFYWEHAMQDGRDAKMSAVLTEDFEHSLIFYQDGMQTKYHNPSRIELDTRAAENFAVDNSTVKAAEICAAICMPDKSRIIFFNNGMCTKFDDSMTPLETTSTVQLFPNLKSKVELLSAARVDPRTELAFFYFRDGSFQIFDTVEIEVIGEFPAGEDWQTSAKYLAREKLPTRRIKSPNVELVTWCFDHGMTQLLCKPENKIIKVDSASEFGDQLMPPVGASINVDAEDAQRTMLTLRRFARHGSYVPLETLTIHGSQPLSDEFLDEMDVSTLHSLEIHCPVSLNQLKRIPMRGIETLSMSHVTNDHLQAIATHFPHLTSLSVDTGKLSDDALRNFKSEHPNVKVIVTKNKN